MSFQKNRISKRIQKKNQRLGFNRILNQQKSFYSIFFFFFYFLSPSNFLNLKLGFNQPVFAIVNIESLRKEKASQNPFQGSLALNFKKMSGNTEKTSFNLKSHVLLKGKNSENLLFFEHRLGKSKKIRDRNQSLIHLRHTHFSASSLALESYGQMQTNEFRRLRLRALIGGGIRKKLLDRELKSKSKNEQKNPKFQKINLGFSVFYSEEYKEKLKLSNSNEMSPEKESEKKKEKTFRLSHYLSFNIPLDSLLALKMIIYFQPKWNDWKDYHILEEASLELKIRPLISLVFTQSILFDSRAPRNVKKRDFNFNSSLRFNF